MRFSFLARISALMLAASVTAQIYAEDQPSLLSDYTAQPAGYTATRYPLMLVHGMLGWNTMQSGMEYWHEIPAALEEGGATVYVATVTGLESSEFRGEELLLQMEEIAAAEGVEKFHLIGHSHGGPTARYAAAIRPDLVASITSIGSPHFGSPVADLVLQSENAPASDVVTYATLEAVGTLINGFSTTPTEDGQNARASMVSLSTEGSADFNRRYPWGMPSEPCGTDAERFIDWNDAATKTAGRMFFYSWTGIQPLTNPADPSDAALATTSAVFGSEPNDGLVGQCSAYFGEMIEDSYGMNHLDETNLMYGLHNILEQDPVEIIRVHANRLKQLELTPTFRSGEELRFGVRPKPRCKGCTVESRTR